MFYLPAILKIPINLFLIGWLISCSPSPEKQEIQVLEPLPLSYAKGFKIFQGEGFKVIEVLQAYPGKHDPFRYLVLETKLDHYDATAYDAVILPRVKRVILTSTTHVPHLDLLGISRLLIGFPDTDLISSELMRKQIRKGKVADLGTGPQGNIEMMVDLDPDLVVFSTLGNDLQQISLLQKAGIPAVLNGEYTEPDPLGRAEWIKFSGALTGKYEESVRVFEEVEAAYQTLKEKISQAKTIHRPTVISGVMYQDIWYAPAGGNWAALFLKDAGADYIFKNKAGTGSLQLNYEYVLDKAMEAGMWIGAADFVTLEQMEEADPRYANFEAYKNGEVYTFTKKRGATGGIEYFELGYIRPDIVLKDLVKILHPELLPDYEPYFYKKLNRADKSN